MVWNTEKCSKWAMHTGGPGTLQKTVKLGKWGKDSVWPGLWWVTLKIMENEGCTLEDL